MFAWKGKRDKSMKVSVVIPVHNEASTLSKVLAEVKKLEPYEIIIVDNGSTDGTKEIALQHHCRVIYYNHSLGNDVGRAIGAREAKGEIVLFLDGDIVMKSEELYPFIKGIQQGHQIVLNNLTWSVYLKVRPHYTTVGKYMLNRYLNKKEFVVGSLIAIPHAISREVIEKLGWWNLTDPALFQAMAMSRGVDISDMASVDVIYTNKVRPVHTGTSPDSPYPKATSRIMGDHLRALQYITETYGKRGGFSEGNRDREFIGKYKPVELKKEKAKYSAIIPVSEEKTTIRSVIQEVKKAGVDEIIIVANGADIETIKQVNLENVIVVEVTKTLGNNVARAIGAMHATAEICLFVDGDFAIPAKKLVPFLRAIEDGSDMALNDLQCLLDIFHPADPISMGKYFVNLVAKRPDLWNNSLTAVPHAIHKKVIEKIGYDSLIIPPLAQMKAILEGFSITTVEFVDVITTNRVRPEQHEFVNGRISAFDRIFGDQLEAIAYLLQYTDERGGFTDGDRDREIIQQLRREEENTNEY
ncbi:MULTISPECIES: glycosyltransferase family 2 protein [Bacillus]|uniref:glycosyltransferase family 2 protein n=1 Tax=Bacillus TaxID=1386 RepID=UPI000A303763|nr:MULTISPECIES: glycosyltransferase family 2 protein [Bacillus cereus group]MCU5057651.1 glycosyltransferase family 2 protein [Bacillus cereus]QKI11797.1 glycosyltransferase [Bacillus cereus]USL02984.1 glycosyltransferase family 2 protein [Bacillus anthracis]SMD65110.1 Undecaprenyl-phosphate 4-deoxy-4-formamido-L-arabinose transferase [Bacillus cereus]HDR6304753.1 glycosyltransferase [Bacillus cereus]